MVQIQVQQQNISVLNWMEEKSHSGQLTLERGFGLIKTRLNKTTVHSC